MLIYRDTVRRVETRHALAHIAAAATGSRTDSDAALSLFIDVAELEAGIIDAMSPDGDRLDPLSCALRNATIAAAANWLREDGGPLSELLDAVGRHALPDTIAMRVSEGYAYYALFPETYAHSAARFWSVMRPSRVAVIGIRSIGTGLSAIVVQTLRARGCQTWSCTVRPRGHPFDRRLAVTPDIEDAWRAEAAGNALFAIVDEGPGLSGSSFSSVVQTLHTLGVPRQRIVLFPSWDPDPDRLKSEAARDTWRTHRRWCTHPHGAGVTPEAIFGIAAPLVDLSAGAWRSTFLCNRGVWPAVQPQHERWKVAVPSEQRLVRFAGLGRYGEAARNRAHCLSDLGLGPRPGPWRHGFLEMPFVPGRPLTACRHQLDATQVGRYIGTIAREFPAGAPADTPMLEQMIDTNAGELLDAASADRVRRTVRNPPRDLRAAFIDGRMLAHEWIRTRDGLVKVDAIDHHCDHFYPGVQSAAWDLAGAIVEMRMDDRHTAAMVGEYERVSGDRHTVAALPFYRMAYAAFRAGYAAVAAETLAGTDEGARFSQACDNYRRTLTAPSVP